MNVRSKVVFFGGFGLIGEHLVRLLLKMGFENIVLIQRNIGSSNSKFFSTHFQKCKMLAYNFSSDSFEAVVGKELIDAEHVFDLTLPDDKCFMKGCLQNCVLEFCKKHNTHAVHYFMGTRLEYRLGVSVLHVDTPLDPVTEYGRRKLHLENMYRLYSSKYGIPVVFLRLSNIYGYSFNFSGKKTFVNTLVTNAMDNEALILDLPGEAFKDFLYIDDLVSALFLAMNTDLVIGNTFNIGSGNKTTMFEIVEIVTTRFPQIDIEHFEDPNKGPDSFVFDISAIQSLVNWNPLIGFSEGFSRVCKLREGM